MKSTQDNLTDGLTIDVSGSSPEQDDQCINRHVQDLQKLFAPWVQEDTANTRPRLQSFLASEFQKKIEPIRIGIRERLEELAERHQNCLKTLIAYGWFLSPDTPIEQLQLLTDSLAVNAGREKQDAIGSYCRGRIDSIERDLSGAYPRRSQILHDAFEAHRTGKYTLSIPVFLSQADGIWYDQFSKAFFRSRKRGNTLKKCKNNPQLQYIATILTLLEPKEQGKNNPLWANETERDSSFDALNRHQVLHGSVDYETEPNSLKAISLLDCFRGICRRVAQEKPRVPV